MVAANTSTFSRSQTSQTLKIEPDVAESLVVPMRERKVGPSPLPPIDELAGTAGTAVNYSMESESELHSIIEVNQIDAGSLLPRARLGGAAVVTAAGVRLPILQSSLELEAIKDTADVPHGAHTHGTSGASGELCFFRPVDGNLSHHTILGAGLDRFESMLQLYRPLGFSNKADKSVTLGAPGGPVAGSLKMLPYAQLSKSLTVWHSGSTDLVLTTSESELLHGMFTFLFHSSHSLA